MLKPIRILFSSSSPTSRLFSFAYFWWNISADAAANYHLHSSFTPVRDPRSLSIYLFMRVRQMIHSFTQSSLVSARTCHTTHHPICSAHDFLTLFSPSFSPSSPHPLPCHRRPFSRRLDIQQQQDVTRFCISAAAFLFILLPYSLPPLHSFPSMFTTAASTQSRDERCIDRQSMLTFFCHKFVDVSHDCH